MKIRFNPETQTCEMLTGAAWTPLTPTDAPGDYCAFEIPATLPIAYALTTEHDGPAITIHVSEAAATTAALAYVREELAERDDLRGTEHLAAFDAALARDGVEAALEAARDEHSPEVWYTIEEVTLPVAPCVPVAPPVAPPKAYELVTRGEAGDAERTLHTTEAEATEAALAYVRRELEPLADPDTDEPLLDKFNLAVERDGVADALADALDQYGPEISYTIEEVVLPSRAPSGVPTFEQLVAWCEEFDGDPTEGWLLRVLSGEVTIDNFNRAVLAGTAPEGV